MKAGFSYVADPLNTDVREVAYSARHYGCPVLRSAECRSCEGNIGSSWCGRNGERKTVRGGNPTSIFLAIA